MKKVFLGLLVAGVTLAGSAFTNAKFAAGDIYGNKTAGQYSKIVNPYNSLLCQNVATTDCAYRVTSLGASHVIANFTSSQAVAYLSNGWIETIDAKKGLYTGL